MISTAGGDLKESGFFAMLRSSIVVSAMQGGFVPARRARYARILGEGARDLDLSPAGLKPLSSFEQENDQDRSS